MWLEAARLEKPANAKAVLAKACGSVLVSSMVELLRQRLASPGSCGQNAAETMADCETERMKMIN